MDVVEIFLLDHSSLSWFKEHINTTKHNERQKELFVFAFLENITTTL